MESSGVVFRPGQCFSGAGFRRTQLVQTSLSGTRLPGDVSPGVGLSRDFRIPSRPRKFYGLSEFCDDGHLRYYAVVPRCGKKKEKDSTAAATKALKKRIKVIKALSRDLSMVSVMGNGVRIGEDLVGNSNEKIVISEAAEGLLAQLQKLRAEEKEMKRRKKEEKAALKAARKKAMANRDASPSSSSESSDGVCREVVDMSRLRSTAIAEPKINQPPLVQSDAAAIIPSSVAFEKDGTAPLLSLQGQNASQAFRNQSFLTCGTGCSSSSISSTSSTRESSNIAGGLVNKIEVCMGGKCKKSGAAALLEEFEKMVGVEGIVVGCKCMGKCRDGPNVRVLNCGSENFHVKEGASVRPLSNPLCIGVGLEDVGSIIANFFGEKHDMRLQAAS